MPISPTSLNVGAFVYVKPAKTGAGAATPQAAVDAGKRQDLLTARSQLLRLFVAIQELAGELDVSTGLRLDLPDAQSTQGLGLDLSSTAAFLQSLDEINSSSHSFSPFGPNWSGASSALLTIGGEYDGSDGSGNLSFQVVRPGTHCVDNLRIRVRDPSGSIISNVNVRANDDPNMQYNLQNDTSNCLQSAKLGNAAVTPGTEPESQRALSPVAAFSAVQSGSVLINGTSITIDAGSDSLETIVATINASGAALNASFDTQTQRVLIQANDPASILEIDSNGTGHFAALRMLEGRVDPVADGRGVSRRRSYDIADSMESMMSELNVLFRDSAFLNGADQTKSFRARLNSAVSELFT